MKGLLMLDGPNNYTQNGFGLSTRQAVNIRWDV